MSSVIASSPGRPQAVVKTDRLSICIVSHNGYGAMAGGQDGFIGGVEWQTSFLARWLAQQGHAVTMLTWGDPATGVEHFDGVRVLKVCPKEAGLPKLKFFYPRWTSLMTALHRADADVYYHNCGEAVTGQIARWCRRHARPFVFSVASDADCDPRLPELGLAIERALYRSGLRLADERIAQTQTQQRNLTEHFGVSSTIIPLPCSVPAVAMDGAARKLNRVLWVGRMCLVKRPDRLLELAAALPEFEFDFVGPFHDEAYSRDIKERAPKLLNVKVHGPLPRERVFEFYREAAFLCCTSNYEGFPNTFLEAWSQGVPVVATVNPDGLLTSRRLGVAVSRFEDMATALRALAKDPARYQAMAQNARQYFAQNHTVDAVMPRFEAVLRQAALGRAAKQATA